jgi:signal transduction histidine kinase
MYALAELILSNEKFILKRTLAYAKRHNYIKFAATLEEAWRVSISGLSHALVTAINTYNDVPELDVNEDYSLDQIAAFGILEARRHRYRGVNLEMFLGLMVYDRQAFLDLVLENDLPESIRHKYLLFIIRFFDQVELGFIKEWTSENRESLLEQLKVSNRIITNEKNKYLTIYESIPTPIIILDKDNFIDNLNHSAVEFLQGTALPGTDYYSQNKVRQSIEQIFPWLIEDYNDFIVGNNLTTGIEKQIDLNEKGIKTIFVTFKRMLDVSERFKGTVIIFTDITKRKQMEAAMSRLDRLNLVGEMAASLGHEIRNPMTTVRGYLQILRDNNNYVQDRDAFELMIEELDRANAIITEFLSLARNKMVELKSINLNSIIKKILPLVNANAMAQEKNIKVETGDIPDLLLDEKEIRQLILNLVGNGLESMNSGGSVTIRTFANNGKVVLSIQDQGHGIKPEILERLGTPFLTTKEDGTGLGLAVCYGIAVRHNASIDVETSENGTSFLVSFPE